MCYLVAATEDEGLNLELGRVVTRHFERRGLTPPRMALALGSAAGDAGQRAGTVFFSQREALYSEAVLIHKETGAMAMAVNLVYAGGADGDGWRLWHGLAQSLGALMGRPGLDYKQMDQASIINISRTLAIHQLLDGPE